ncbi:DUF4212 domain-containing protein [Comamonadaceae bacterium OH2545_COT-014]|nr:DUF4212 domain-containing protein [Comamonadaceae bacterium OH2545_COT-014]
MATGSAEPDRPAATGQGASRLGPPQAATAAPRRCRAVCLRAALLLLWAVAAFGTSWFARDLQAIVLGWPLNYWLLAQGGVLVFIAIGMLDAWAMNRLAPEKLPAPFEGRPRQACEEGVPPVV